MKCLHGGASTPDEPLVTVEKLYKKLKEFMNELHELATKNVVLVDSKSEAVRVVAQKQKSNNDHDDDDDNVDELKLGGLAGDEVAAVPEETKAQAHRDLPPQSPVLILPKKDPSTLGNAICCRCGPPCAPDRPFVSVNEHRNLLIAYVIATDCDYLCLLLVNLLACLLVCLLACLLVCLCAYLFACVLACLLACVFACACLFVCLLACHLSLLYQFRSFVLVAMKC